MIARPTDRLDAEPVVIDEVRSRAWHDAQPPRISALVCTHNRREYLIELLAALGSQSLSPKEFEVVIVDDASTDGTWDLLRAEVQNSKLCVAAVRHGRNCGPAAARNQAARQARSPILAFTDDDCLPTPAWLPSILPAFREGIDVVQGQVRPDPRHERPPSPWDHTIWVLKPSPFFETCNAAYRRTAFERVGGFDERDDLLTPEFGRGFGEDADLAWRVLEGGGSPAFAKDALVYHRYVPRSFRRWLRGRRHTAGFPALARRSPLVAQRLRCGLFLNTKSAAFDTAVVGLALAGVLRRPWPLLAALPWLRLRWADSVYLAHGDRSRAAGLLVQHGVSDLVTFASLLEGSVRHRRLIL